VCVFVLVQRLFAALKSTIPMPKLGQNDQRIGVAKAFPGHRITKLPPKNAIGAHIERQKEPGNGK
jgi:hypothetical protein